MRRCLEELEVYMNEAGETLPHLVRVALVHYQFETIHPFRNGNGRVGRLIVPLLLCSYERLEGPTLYLSPYFERHRAQSFGEPCSCRDSPRRRYASSRIGEC